MNFADRSTPLSADEQGLFGATANAVPRGALNTAAQVFKPSAIMHDVGVGNLRKLAPQMNEPLDDEKFHAYLMSIGQSRMPTDMKWKLLNLANRVRAGAVPVEAVPDITAKWEKNLAGDTAKAITDFAAEHFPVSQEQADRFPVKVGYGVGSMLTFLATRAATGLPGAIAFSSLAGQGEAMERAQAAGADPKDIAKAQLYGTGIGLTELVPLENVLKPITHLPGVKNTMLAIGKKMLQQGALEGGQEALAGVMQNTVAKMLHTPEQDILQGIADEGLVGFTVGMLSAGGLGGVQTITDQGEIVPTEGVPEFGKFPATVPQVRRVALELDFGAGSPLARTYPDFSGMPLGLKAQITSDVLDKAVDMAGRYISGTVRKVTHGVGGWQDYPVQPATVLEIDATTGEAGLFADIIGYLAQQTEVWEAHIRPVERGDTMTPSNAVAVDFVDVDNNALTDPDAISKVRDAIRAAAPDLQGFQQFDHLGRRGLRFLVLGGDKAAIERQMPKLLGVLNSNGWTFEVAADNARVNIHGTDWNTDPEGQEYLSRIRDKAGERIAEAVRTHHRAEIDGIVGSNLAAAHAANPWRQADPAQVAFRNVTPLGEDWLARVADFGEARDYTELKPSSDIGTWLLPDGKFLDAPDEHGDIAAQAVLGLDYEDEVEQRYIRARETTHGIPTREAVTSPDKIGKITVRRDMDLFKGERAVPQRLARRKDDYSLSAIDAFKELEANERRKRNEGLHEEIVQDVLQEAPEMRGGPYDRAQAFGAETGALRLRARGSALEVEVFAPLSRPQMKAFTDLVELGWRSIYMDVRRPDTRPDNLEFFHRKVDRDFKTLHYMVDNNPTKHSARGLIEVANRIANGEEPTTEEIKNPSRTAQFRSVPWMMSYKVVTEADIDIIKQGKMPELDIGLASDLPEGFDQVGVSKGDNARGVVLHGGKTVYFVDNTGMGSRGEPALTQDEFLKKVEPGYVYAIVEEGPFQIKVGKFRPSHRVVAPELQARIDALANSDFAKNNNVTDVLVEGRRAMRNIMPEATVTNERAVALLERFARANSDDLLVQVHTEILVPFGMVERHTFKTADEAFDYVLSLPAEYMPGHRKLINGDYEVVHPRPDILFPPPLTKEVSEARKRFEERRAKGEATGETPAGEKLYADIVAGLRNGKNTPLSDKEVWFVAEALTDFIVRNGDPEAFVGSNMVDDFGMMTVLARYPRLKTVKGKTERVYTSRRGAIQFRDKQNIDRIANNLVDRGVERLHEETELNTVAHETGHAIDAWAGIVQFAQKIGADQDPELIVKLDKQMTALSHTARPTAWKMVDDVSAKVMAVGVSEGGLRLLHEDVDALMAAVNLPVRLRPSQVLTLTFAQHPAARDIISILRDADVGPNEFDNWHLMWNYLHMPQELTADSLAQTMLDPVATKRTAPTVVQFFRDLINNDETINHIIQIGGFLPFLAVPNGDEEDKKK